MTFFFQKSSLYIITMITAICVRVLENEPYIVTMIAAIGVPSSGESTIHCDNDHSN